MVNPLISCFDWFVQFMQIIPTPCLSFLWLALALFFTSAVGGLVCSLFVYSPGDILDWISCYSAWWLVCCTSIDPEVIPFV